MREKGEKCNVENGHGFIGEDDLIDTCFICISGIKKSFIWYCDVICSHFSDGHWYFGYSEPSLYLPIFPDML